MYKKSEIQRIFYLLGISRYREQTSFSIHELHPRNGKQHLVLDRYHDNSRVRQLTSACSCNVSGPISDPVYIQVHSIGRTV
jgi:hypothetical protein